MRDTAKAAPARPNPRKPTDHGAGMPSGHLRFAVLAVTVAAFLLIPVAQATAGGLKVNMAGSGDGEVKTVPFYDGAEPPIECAYEFPGPATGTCESPVGEGFNALVAIPAEGSHFVGWTVETGVTEENSCFSLWGLVIVPEFWIEDPIAIAFPDMEGACFIEPEDGNSELTATFEGVGGDPGTPLTVVKLGEGTVVSSPPGIECTGAKTGAECKGDFEPNGQVTFTASPAAGWAFSSWSGCLEHVGLTCKVKMDKAKTVMVTFVKTPSLTVEKAGSGYGKVAAMGISCDESCSKASSAVKTGASVTVKVTPAKGSEAAVFEGGTGSASGCSGGTCTFTISENSAVKVKFDPKPTKTLTVNLTGPAAYKGRVSGKGKGSYGPAINCGAGCTSQTESFFSADEVTLGASAPMGYTFSGWSVSGGSAGTCTGTTNPCAIPTNANKTVSAEFK